MQGGKNVRTNNHERLDIWIMRTEKGDSLIWINNSTTMTLLSGQNQNRINKDDPLHRIRQSNQKAHNTFCFDNELNPIEREMGEIGLTKDYPAKAFDL